MPDCDGVAVALISQYDACTVPEYAPPSSQDPFVETPKLFDPDERLVTVYSPIYPTSQFWTAYQISPEAGTLAPYFYFKLFVDGRHIVSWGCGGYKCLRGKTMFALFRGHTDGTGLSEVLETRALYFGSANNTAIADLKQDTIEVRVYRSRARRRSLPSLQYFKDTTAAVFDIHKKGAKEKHERAVALFNAGPLMWGQPRRYYKYALLDPTDQPYVRFRYVLRSIKQLADLGVISPMSMSINNVGNSESSGPSNLRILQSMSMESIATSIASDTDIGKSLLFPLADDFNKSPSPLRIPPILSIKTNREGAENRYRVVEMSHKFFNPFVNTQSLVASQIFEPKIPMHLPETTHWSDADGENLLSEGSNPPNYHDYATTVEEGISNADVESSTDRRLHPTSSITSTLLRSKTSRESLLRGCVSDLLAFQRRELVNSASLMNDRGILGQQWRLPFKGSVEALCPKRTCDGAQSYSGPASGNDANSVDIYDELHANNDKFLLEPETCPEARTRQQSVTNLKIALHSALRRSQRKKAQNKACASSPGTTT